VAFRHNADFTQERTASQTGSNNLLGQTTYAPTPNQVFLYACGQHKNHHPSSENYIATRSDHRYSAEKKLRSHEYLS